MFDLDRAKKVIDLQLRRLEGEKLHVYRCSAGVPTIGVGATMYPDGRKVTMQDPPITVDRMNEMLAHDINVYTSDVLALVEQECTTAQLVGLCLLMYNIGKPGFGDSTVLRLHRKRDYTAAASAFSMWDKTTDPVTKQKVKSEALAVRRLKESAIYISDLPASVEPAPQAVTEEAPITASKTVRTNTATAAGGVGMILTQMDSPWLTQVFPKVADTIKDVAAKGKEVAQALDINLGVVFGLALLAAGVYSIYLRWQNKQAGRV
jgi:lysozyme